MRQINNYKKFAVALLTFLLCSSATYAETATLEGEPTLIRDQPVGGFWDNWYLSVGAGANLYIGDYNDNLSQHITPTINLSLGKWVIPWFGVRLQYNGISMKTTGDPSFWYTSDAPGNERVEFSYHAVHTDFMVNLNKAIAGINPNRKYELIPFFGWGWSQSQSKRYSDRKRNEFFAMAGLKNNFKVTSKIDLNLELTATLVSQRIAGHMTGGSPNYPLGASVGFGYNFGNKKTRNQRTSTPSTTAPTQVTNNEVETLQANYKLLAAENKELKLQIIELAGKEATITKVVEKQATPVVVFFKVSQSTLSNKEVGQLRYIAEFMKENPDAKFVVYGYADSKTGNASFNQQLSNRRAQATKNVLVKHYGINPDQLEVSAQGGVNTLFAHYSLNRAVVVAPKEVAEKSQQ